MKMVSAGAAGLDYRDGSPAASRSSKSRAEREAKLEALLTQVEPGGESSEEKGGE